MEIPFRYYLWVDGIHFGVRLEDAAQCILVVVGTTPEGKKELMALSDGYRESEASWRELLLGLKSRGLNFDPHLAIGDGALGFWKALPQVFGTTRPQRCWVHKTANVLNKLPKSQQPRAKAALHEIWMAATRRDAEKAFDHFLTVYRPKYLKAAECLEKDREELLAFYDFPAEQWIFSGGEERVQRPRRCDHEPPGAVPETGSWRSRRAMAAACRWS